MSILPFEPEEQLTRQAVNERVLEVKAHVEDQENPHGVAAWQVTVSREAAEFLGMDLSSSSTVDDALISAVLAGKSACLIKLAVTVDGKPAKAGLAVYGMSDLNGVKRDLLTDANGKVVGLTAFASTTVGVNAYTDLVPGGVSLSTPIKRVVNAELALRTNKSIVSFSSSATAKFSPYVKTVDVSGVGGGGAGAGGDVAGAFSFSLGGGGGAGSVTEAYGITVRHNETVTILVGAGGTPVQQKNGNPGGDTTFTFSVSGRAVIAPGGGGGGRPAGGTSNNGTGGTRGPGGNATKKCCFGTRDCGGGGGGGAGYSAFAGEASIERYPGGTPFGGTGALVCVSGEYSSWGTDGTAASGCGGGGGGGAMVGTRWQGSDNYLYAVKHATAGQKGAAYMRFHF